MSNELNESNEYEAVCKYTPELDNSILMSMLLVGISLMWSAFSNFSIVYWDIGINMSMVVATNTVLGCVSTILSLFSMRHSEMRFGMTFFFLSMMLFITCCTSMLPGGHSTDEVAICLLPLFFCMISMIRHKDWLISIALIVFFVAEGLLWHSIGDYTLTVFAGYGISGAMFLYYASGILLLRDVKSDVLRVTSSVKYDSTIAEPSVLFDTIDNVIVGMLMFLAGSYLYTQELTSVTSVPVLIVSAFVIIVSFFGMERGLISGGLLALIVGLYFLCKSVAVLTTGTASIEMMAIILVIPLVVLIYIFWREFDVIGMVVCAMLIVYFLIAGFVGYVAGTSALLTILAFVFMYCGICNLVKQEFHLELPFYKYL